MFEILGEDSEIRFQIVLADIILHEYREYLEIWSLLKDEQWHYYRLMNIKELREQTLLYFAGRNLKFVILEKIQNYGKKKKKTGYEDDENDSE